MTALPRVYADFEKTDDKRRVLLTTVGTREDLARLGIELRPGLLLLLYRDDLDAQDKGDDLIAEGTVEFNGFKNRWVAVIDWDAVRHESETRGSG
jgi:hypothetical protein